MPNFEGLNKCSAQFNDFCITYSIEPFSKSIEFSCSLVLFIGTFYQLCSRIKRQRQVNFFVVISFLIEVSLLCNLCELFQGNMLFCWFHKAYFLYDLQVFAFSLYFITIVYQVGLRLVQKSQKIKKIYWILVHGIFLIFLCANVAVLILRLTDLDAKQLCNETLLLVLQVLGIVLSISMVVGGLKYQKNQKLKVSSLYKQQHLNNPMPSMWKWISVNIISQAIGLSESIYLQFSPDNDCTFSANMAVQSSLNLFFEIFSYHLGIFSTYWFLRRKYQQAQMRRRVNNIVKKNSLRKDSTGDDTNNIELVIGKFSQRIQ